MAEPIYQNQPDNLAALSRKYSDPALTSSLSQSPDYFARAVAALDTERVAKGQKPVSTKQTTAAVQAIQTGNVTAAPETPNDYGSLIKGIPANATRNLRDIVTNIPKLPGAVVNEVRELPTIGAKAAEAKSLADYANLPGVRMLPGAFIAGNLSNPKELLRNPLFTGLDVLPAGKAKILKGGTQSIGQAAMLTKPGRAIGELGSFAKSELGATKAGQLARRAFGQDARQTARIANQADFELQAAAELTASDQLYKRALDSEIPEERIGQLTRALETDTLDQLDITATERALIDDYRTINDEMANRVVDEAGAVKIDGEVYDPTVGNRILGARRTANSFKKLSEVRDRITSSSGMGDDLAELQSRARGDILDTDLTRNQRKDLARGYVHAIDAAGYETGDLLSRITKANTADDLANLVDEHLANPVARPTRSISTLIESLSPYAKQPKVAILIDNLKNNRFGQARKVVRGLARRKSYVIPELQATLDDVARFADRQKFLDKTAGYTPKTVARLEKQAAGLVTRNAPARFQPLVEAGVKDQLKILYGTGDDIARVTQAVADRSFSEIPGLTSDKYTALFRDVESTWQAMKDEGLDPVFVHRVTPDKALASMNPKVMVSAPSISSAKRRSIDASPHVDNMFVALRAQELEFLAKRGSEDMVGTMVNTFGKSAEDIRAQYLPAARLRAGDGANVDAALDQLVKREWVEFDPDSFISFKSPKLNSIKSNGKTMIPRTVADNLKMMRNSPISKGLSAPFDKVMKVFRTSVLPLSPRWHLYNVFGGAMMLGAQAGPEVFKYLSDARVLLKGDEITIRGSKLSIKDSKFLQMNQGAQTRMYRDFNMTAGKQLGAWIAKGKEAVPSATKALDAVESGAGKLSGKGATAGEAFNKVVDKSYQVNGMVDDMYRTMAYLYDYDKALTKGMTKEAAMAAGEKFARKTFQTWSELTPIERQVMRTVFPFYGFTQHILRYTLNYPMDHPFRTAMMSSIVQAELDDWEEGLPERFQNAFFLGDPDENGNVKTLMLGGANPFKDVANLFTLSGFVSQLNPVAQTALESVGVDTRTGSSELYPNLTYDPETGRLVAQNPNVAQSLLTNTIPQAGLLTALSGASAEWKELSRRNPDAAGRMLLSSVGIPVVMRSINPTQEVLKTEITRQDLQRDVFNEAIASGDYSEAKKYPALTPLLGQINQLQAQNKLTNYQPPPNQVSPIKLAQASLVRSVTGKPQEAQPMIANQGG